MSEPRRVLHRKFGLGTVLREAHDGKLEVAFDAGGTRLLLPQFLQPAPAVVEETPPGPPASLGDPLLDAVLADPADDAARAAFRDALLAKGDPRGEAIVLGEKASLTDTERTKLRAIEAEHGRAWLGPLDQVLAGVRFSRGFLDAATARWWRSPTQRAELLGHPLWATARELVTLNPEMMRDLLPHPCLRSLRRASLSGAALSAIARRSTPAPLEAVIAGISHSTIDFDGRPTGLPFPHGPDVDDEAAWDDALQIGALQSLRALTLWLAPENDAPVAYGLSAGPYHQGAARTDPKRIAWLLSSPLGQQIEVLDVAVGSSPRAVLNVGPWIDAVRGMRSLRRATLRARFENLPWDDVGVVAFVIEREASGAVLVRIQTDARFRSEMAILERIQRCLRGFPRRDVPRATIEHFTFGRPEDPTNLVRLHTGLSPLFVEIGIRRGEMAVL